jgi:photosystem II stability/assembly factor-like uncharacterized protein
MSKSVVLEVCARDAQSGRGARIGFRSRLALLAALIGAAVAIMPAAASAKVPYAQWYWTMVVARSNPSVLILGTNSGLYRSSDGGGTWQPIGPKDVNTSSLVESGGTMFAAGVSEASANAVPVSKIGDVYLVPSGPSVLVSSSDDGSTWKVIHPSGLPAVPVQALAVDPANSQILYAVLKTGSIYRSTDDARSFAAVSSKIGGTPWALAITQGSNLVAGNMTNGNFVSPNATSWHGTGFTDPDGSHMVMEYAVSPTDLTKVLMTSYGIVMSSDGGKTWHVVLKSKVMFGPVAYSPTKPSLAYAIGFDGSLWRSGNGGTTWTKVS